MKQFLTPYFLRTYTTAKIIQCHHVCHSYSVLHQCRFLRHSVKHTHTNNHFTALWILSKTSWVSRYQKKHSPTHTYRGHQSVIPCLLPPSIMIDGIFSVQFACLTVFLHNLSPSFLRSASWPGTLHSTLHTFLHPIIVFFLHFAAQPISS